MILLQISKAEFEEFERMVEKDQNRHLFFQGLYKREEEKKKHKSKKASTNRVVHTPIREGSKVMKEQCLPFPGLGLPRHGSNLYNSYNHSIWQTWLETVSGRILNRILSRHSSKSHRLIDKTDRHAGS